MPTLVFPAPGAPFATRLTTTFSGFDIAPVTKTTIRNLLLDSQQFTGPNWSVGPYAAPFNTITDYISDSILQPNVTASSLTIDSYSTPYDVVTDYILDSILQPSSIVGTLTKVTAASNTQRIGQQINVIPNTTYTFSFYARRGSATNNVYKILDFSRNVDLVSPTSYYSQLNFSTLTRITVTFTTTPNTRILVLYPIWDIASGYGNSYITNAQFELGNSASTYQATYSSSNSAANITVNTVVATIRAMQQLRQTASNVVAGKLKAGTTVKSVTALNTSLIEKFKVPYKNTQLFYTPLTSKLSSAQVLRDTKSKLTQSNLNLRLFKLTGVARLFVSNIEKFKVPYKNTQLFYTPLTSKLSSAQVLTGIKAPLETKSKLSSTTRLKSTTALETKPKLNTTARLTGDRTRLNPAEQFAKVKFPNPIDLKTKYGLDNRLSTFDNVGLVEGTAYTVTSINSGVKANTVLDYIYDLDKITTTTVNVTQLIVSFDNPEMRYVFGVGSYVTLESTTTARYTAQVLDRTPNTVTIAKPFRWDTTWLFTTITSASIAVYPQSNVIPTRHPSTPREWLLYSQLIPVKGSAFVSTEYTKPLWDAYFFNYTGTTQSLASGTLQRPIAKLTSASTAIQQGNVNTPTFKLTSVPTPILGIAKTITKLVADSRYSIITNTAPTIRKFSIDFNGVRLFNTPQIGKLSAGIKVKADNNYIAFGKTISVTTLKTPTSGLLQANIERNSFKLKGTTRTGTDSVLTQVFGLDKFKVPVGSTQVFYTPSSSKISSIQKLKDVKVSLPLEVLSKQSLVLKDTRSVLRQDNISLQLYKLAGEVRIQTSLIEKLKVKNTQVFYTPDTNRLTAAQVLRDTRLTLPTGLLSQQSLKLKGTRALLLPEMLSKQSLVLKDTRSKIAHSNLALQLYKLAGEVRIQTSLIEKLKVKNTQVFYTPDTNRLTAAQVLRTVTSKLTADKATAVTKLKTDTVLLTTLQFDKWKVSYNRTQVFYTPSSSKISSIQKLKDVKVSLPLEVLSKQSLVLKDTRSKIAHSNLALQLYKLAGEVRIQTSLIEKLKVKNTQVFYTPDTNRLNSTAVLKSIIFDSKISKLTSILVLKTTSTDIRPNYIRQVPYKNTQVFETPRLSKLTAGAVLKADRATVNLSSFKISSIPVRGGVYNLTTSYLPKAATLLKQGGTVNNSANIDNTFYQRGVITTVAPINAREVLFYANMAPGRRTNNSIQQGKLFSTVGPEPKANRLEVFDNVKFASDPVYNIISQSAGIKANTVLDYIYDLDIITVNTTPITTLQLSFDNTDRQFYAPYPVGSYIVLTMVNRPDYFAQVLDCSFNTVTIAKPADWEIPNWIALTVGNASPSVFPKTKVIPDGRPKNPREMLFYSEMAFGYVQNRTIENGDSFGGPQDLGIQKSSYLQKDTWKIKGVSISSSAGLIKPLSKFAGMTQTKFGRIEPIKWKRFAEVIRVTSSSGVIKARSVVKGIKNEFRLISPGLYVPDRKVKSLPALTIGQFARVKWGINPNQGTRFAEVIRLESVGGIIRFKTGVFNKMHDVAVKKKDPIQFWN